MYMLAHYSKPANGKIHSCLHITVLQSVCVFVGESEWIFGQFGDTFLANADELHSPKHDFDDTYTLLLGATAVWQSLQLNDS